MDQGPRYAIYFVPAADSNFYRYGSSILGYDCYTGKTLDFPEGSGDQAVNWSQITAQPRRYGFHASMKAPFHLSPSCTEPQLVNALQSFAGLGHAVHSFAPTVTMLDDFFAIVPLQADAALDVLAASCTTIFDAYRAPMSPQERARRIALGLSQSQIQNLDRWGYPYALSEFRFHMTLTGKIPMRRRMAIFAILLNGLHRLPVERQVALDRLALLRQDSSDASFRVISESNLTGGTSGTS